MGNNIKSGQEKITEEITTNNVIINQEVEDNVGLQNQANLNTEQISKDI